MIYTIGRTAAYEQNFRELPVVEKLGRTPDYQGGSVWKTREDAQKECPSDYSVYGVEADWEQDTEPSKEGSWHDLLKTSKLVKLT
jgi:hypothetical protein